MKTIKWILGYAVVIFVFSYLCLMLIKSISIYLNIEFSPNSSEAIKIGWISVFNTIFISFFAFITIVFNQLKNIEVVDKATENTFKKFQKEISFLKMENEEVKEENVKLKYQNQLIRKSKYKRGKLK